MENPTLSDVARTAGVSYATADRVINERGNVAEKSIRKVRDAMTSLGYVRNLAAANLSRGRIYRLAFLLPTGKNAFFTRIRQHLLTIADHLANDRITIEIIDVAAFAGDALQSELARVVDRGFDGLAVVGLQNAQLAQPLAQLRARGVRVVGLVSDLPVDQRAAYIGIDNAVAGRTAARMVGMAHGGSAGRVLMIAGSLDARDHAERLAGFRAVIQADYPQIELLDVVMTKDDGDVVQRLANAALKADGAISAVYNAGAGNSGLIAALTARNQTSPVFCVVHELVPHSRQALLDGVIDLVIDQRPDVEVSRACTILRALIDERDPPPMPPLVPAIYVRDNIPADVSAPAMKDHTL